MELVRWRFILAIVAFSSFWNTNEREMQKKIWNVYKAIILQVPLPSDLSCQLLVLHLELCEMAADHEQAQLNISFSPCTTMWRKILEYLR